jgi:hypothetical protein
MIKLGMGTRMAELGTCIRIAKKAWTRRSQMQV